MASAHFTRPGTGFYSFPGRTLGSEVTMSIPSRQTMASTIDRAGRLSKRESNWCWRCGEVRVGFAVLSAARRTRPLQ
jgi:hypothetical protein